MFIIFQIAMIMLSLKRLFHVRMISGLGKARSLHLAKPKRTLVSWSVRNSIQKQFNVCSVLRHGHSTQAQDVLNVENKKLRQYLKHLEQKFEDAERRFMLHEETLSSDELRTVHTTITTLGPVVYKFRNYYTKQKELKEFEEMIKGK